MKKIIFLTFFCFPLYAQFNVSWPVYGSVFQRDNNGNATIYFTGQARLATAANIDYRVKVLTNTGSTTSTGSWVNGAASLSSASLYIFRIQLTLTTGWYEVELRARSSGGTTLYTVAKKVGVGEVFVIAGQSNARGEGTTTGVPSLSSYDCVRSLKNNTAYTDITNIEFPVFGQLNYSDGVIGPRGEKSWLYQSLGNQIADNLTDSTVTPVMFFNAAFTGTSINNWNRSLERVSSMFSGNYSNNMGSPTIPNVTEYPEANPWVATGTTDGMDPLFGNLKNVLSFFGNAFGVRAVLWHQGEAETATILDSLVAGYNINGVTPAPYSPDSYRTKLEDLIDATRTILPGLTWAISKASLISQTNSGTWHYNIINNYAGSQSLLQSNPAVTDSAMTTFTVNASSSNHNVIRQQELTVTNNSHVVYFNTNSDALAYPTYRQSDGTHFNEAGLAALANSSYTTLSSALFSKTPILPVAPAITSASFNGTNYTVNVLTPAYGNYTKYQWDSPGYFTFNDYDQTTGSTSYYITSSSAVSGYVKDYQGRIHIIPYLNLNLAGARVASSSKSLVYPNPQPKGEDLTVSFEIPEASKVQYIIKTEYGETIYTSPKRFFRRGKNEIIVPSDIAQKAPPSQREYNFLYLHLKYGDTVEKHKILIK